MVESMHVRIVLIGILSVALCVSMSGAQSYSDACASISGQCLDSDGKPLGFTRVCLVDVRSAEVGSVVASGDGTISFYGISPGSYFLRFSRLGMADAWYGGSERARVVAGPANVNVRFAFPRGQTVSGTYLDSGGAPLGVCDVGLYDAGRRQVAKVATSVNGSFSFSGVAPGRYYLRFSRFGAPDAWYGGANASTVQVGDAPVSVSFSYPAGPSIAGTCVGPSGNPLGFSKVSLFDAADRKSVV